MDDTEAFILAGGAFVFVGRTVERRHFARVDDGPLTHVPGALGGIADPKNLPSREVSRDFGKASDQERDCRIG